MIGTISSSNNMSRTRTSLRQWRFEQRALTRFAQEIAFRTKITLPE